MSRRLHPPRSSSIPVAVLALLLACAPLAAQEGNAAAEPASSADVEAAPVPVGPETPRGAVRAYLDSCRAEEFASAARYLDLGDLPASERDQRGPELARRLKIVLDQTLWVNLDTLSTAPEGHAEDGLPGGFDRVGTIATPRGEIEVLVARGTDPSGASIWQFASSTVGSVPTLWEEFGYGPVGEYLPDEFFTVRFLEVDLWQWLGLALLVFGGWIGAWIATGLLKRAVSPFVRRTQTDLDDRLADLMTGPVRLSIALVLFHLGTYALRLRVPVQESVGGVLKGLGVIAGTWLLMRIAHVITDVIRDRLVLEGRTSVVTMVPLARKTIKAVLIAFAAIGFLQNLGFNITGVLAGLGVGGLAVALAAQKTVENLFGGVMVTVDQPVRVGDFCRFGDKVGTVEEVGLRSTRVRTLDRTVVTVPNAEFAQVQIENFASRDRMRLHTVLGLRYETTPDQLRHVLAGLRRLLSAHPRITDDPARVRFVAFGPHSLDLEVFAYADTTDWNEFLKIREDVYLRMMDVVAESGTGFAFPSQTLYLGRDTGIDREKAEKAEGEVRAWRSEGSLPFPDFSPESLARVENTLDYPPRGSAHAPPADSPNSETRTPPVS